MDVLEFVLLVNGVSILHLDVDVLFIGCLVVYSGDLILGFFVGRESGEEGGVEGRMMMACRMMMLVMA